MEQSVLLATGVKFERRPLADWQAAVRRSTANMRQRLSFMTLAHHSVRNFVVRTLPVVQRPLSVEEIALELGFQESGVQAIIEELERHLFFLVRNSAGEVAWAFPVTADPTLHRIESGRSYSTFGACAEDAFAVAFVLGHLLRQRLHMDIQSVCGGSGRPLQLTVGSDLSWRVRTRDANPLLFVPNINWGEFRGANIINDY